MFLNVQVGWERWAGSVLIFARGITKTKHCITVLPGPAGILSVVVHVTGIKGTKYD